MYLASAVSILEYYATAVTPCQIISYCLWGLKVELNQSPDEACNLAQAIVNWQTHDGESLFFLKSTKNAT